SVYIELCIPSGTTPKIVSSCSFLSLYHIHYLKHWCIPPFFALHDEHQSRRVRAFGIQKSWSFVQEYSCGKRAAYGYIESRGECRSSQGNTSGSKW
ncbi:MAG: hypothetical protein ACK53Y_26895, partial [bacterium]